MSKNKSEFIGHEESEFIGHEELVAFAVKFKSEPGAIVVCVPETFQERQMRVDAIESAFMYVRSRTNVSGWFEHPTSVHRIEAKPRVMV